MGTRMANFGAQTVPIDDEDVRNAKGRGMDACTLRVENRKKEGR